MNPLKAALAVSGSWILAANCFLAGQQAPSQAPPVHQDSIVIRDFENRVDDYLKLRKKLQADLLPLKPKDSAAHIRQSQLLLAQKIQAARAQATQGDIFSLPITRIFKKLIAAPLDGASGAKIRASLHDAEREHPINLGVNQIYPQGFALPSPPPTLLLDLPKLPAELEYRIIGRQLVLRDAAANLIVDFMPEALPASQTGP